MWFSYIRGVSWARRGVVLVGVALALILALVAAFNPLAGAAGLSYGGGGGSGTNVPFASLHIVAVIPTTSRALDVVIKAPTRPTSINPGRTRLELKVPAKTFSAGCTLVIAATPSGVPSLFEADGRLTASYALARAVTGGVVLPAAVQLRRIISIYVGLYCGHKERTTKYPHPVTVVLSSSEIVHGDFIYETTGLKWTPAAGAVVTRGRVTLSLTTNRALEVLRVVRNLRTVSFLDDGGRGVVKSLVVENGSRVVLPRRGVIRPGYRLVGWSLTGRAPVLRSPYLVTRSVVLRAVWRRVSTIEATVSFFDNGGRGVVSPETVPVGALITLPTNRLVHRSGYRLVGWSVDGRAPVLADPYRVTHSLVLSAVWARIHSAEYTVVFLVNGGEGQVQDAVGTLGTLVSLPTGAGLTRPGFRFVGWSVTGTGSPLVGPIVVRGDLTLRAIWKP